MNIQDENSFKIIKIIKRGTTGQRVMTTTVKLERLVGMNNLSLSSAISLLLKQEKRVKESYIFNISKKLYSVIVFQPLTNP